MLNKMDSKLYWLVGGCNLHSSEKSEWCLLSPRTLIENKRRSQWSNTNKRSRRKPCQNDNALSIVNLVGIFFEKFMKRPTKTSIIWWHTKKWKNATPHKIVAGRRRSCYTAIFRTDASWFGPSKVRTLGFPIYNILHLAHNIYINRKVDLC